jgi:hypothetical protein
MWLRGRRSNALASSPQTHFRRADRPLLDRGLRAAWQTPLRACCGRSQHGLEGSVVVVSERQWTAVAVRRAGFRSHSRRRSCRSVGALRDGRQQREEHLVRCRRAQHERKTFWLDGLNPEDEMKDIGWEWPSRPKGRPNSAELHAEGRNPYRWLIEEDVEGVTPLPSGDGDTVCLRRPTSCLRHY